ncbi:hypothetical protein WMF38_14850 [Sorangium sp. So ce118]
MSRHTARSSHRRPRLAQRLSPALTRTAFLAAAEGHAARPAVIDDIHANYTFLARPDAMHLVLYFRGESLAMLHFSVHDPAGPKGWDEVTAATERAQAAANLARIAQQDVELRPVHPAIRRADFAWGSVWAGQDMKAGTQGAGLSYALPASS